ncbi:MAG: CoA-binding protein, partial [Acidimicrobiales bacterium]
MPLRNLQAQGFRGAIYPVNPRHEIVGGLRCYPGLSELPEAPDVALVLVRAELVADAVGDCARAGVRAAIVFAGGFAEAGEQGVLAQRRLGEVASQAGLVCCGPNTLGVLNFVDQVPLTFARADEVGVGRAGNIALVSQSGGVMTALAARAADLGIGLTYGVATGNEADLTAVEVLRWLAEDPRSDALVAVLEEVRDG